ncbi:MAG: amidohydrolase family protein [Candidatus Stygibacter australis]|nr:amidohydrolase family protein [Candidatus Stygibacter australis]MDP8322639.1 amidohydrolase family protein [Candidatus Stygibacter australis]
MEKFIVYARELYDGKKLLKDVYITIEDNMILSVDQEEKEFDAEGIVTPAIIDAHSHIGMDREGEPWQEAELNDHIDQIMPLSDPLNSIYYDDRAFQDAVDFGVLYSCLVPGSGNLIGGKAQIIRNFADNVGGALLKTYGYKMALGFNPRSTTDWKGTRNNTRMGAYALLENKLDELLIKRDKAEVTKNKKLLDLDKKLKKNELDKAEYEEELDLVLREMELGFTPEEIALLDIMSGEPTVKVHVHKEDDILYLIHLKNKYGIKVTADHTLDVWHQEIYDLLAENDIPVVFGPIGAVGYKVELKHAYYQNTGLLMESKAQFGLMTDHPVIHTYSLRDSLKFFLIQGMSPELAIGLITYQNARILGIDDVLGTVEAGKYASLVVWDKNPLDLSAFPKLVMAEGVILRDNG